MSLKTLYSYNVDILGALASIICLVHCVATPFLFMVQATTDHHHIHNAPIWWQSIDFIFIGLSLLAVKWSVKKSSKVWIKFTFWLAWSALTLVILNEKIGLLPLSESVIYIPALTLVGMHLYNRHYC